MLAQALRLKWHISVQGREHVRPGAAILIGNHLSLLDPVIAGLANPWRIAFFTKIEAYQGAGGIFFRLAGQIPLRRGDEEATRWALDMSHEVLRLGSKLAVYPEGTRSPDALSLHRLHRRVLVPIIQANPGVPVHAVAVAYPGRRGGRRQVDLRISRPLDLDAESMSANDITDAVRDALIELGGMPYVDTFAQRLKAPRA